MTDFTEHLLIKSKSSVTTFVRIINSCHFIIVTKRKKYEEFMHEKREIIDGSW